MTETRICGVVSESGPNLEPLACGHPAGHNGPHAWASLPTFVRPATTFDGERHYDVVTAGPARPRDEAAIKHKMTVAITEADDLLRLLWGQLEQARVHRDQVASLDYRSEIPRVRALLAEWRLERN